jgi:hypothetical protein
LIPISISVLYLNPHSYLRSWSQSLVSTPFSIHDPYFDPFPQSQSHHSPTSILIRSSNSSFHFSCLPIEEGKVSCNSHVRPLSARLTTPYRGDAVSFYIKLLFCIRGLMVIVFLYVPVCMNPRASFGVEKKRAHIVLNLRIYSMYIIADILGKHWGILGVNLEICARLLTRIDIGLNPRILYIIILKGMPLMLLRFQFFNGWLGFIRLLSGEILGTVWKQSVHYKVPWETLPACIGRLWCGTHRVSIILIALA